MITFIEPYRFSPLVGYIFRLRLKCMLNEASIPCPPDDNCASLVGWGTGNRTPIKGFKGLCPTVRRSPKIINLFLLATILPENSYQSKLNW